MKSDGILLILHSQDLGLVLQASPPPPIHQWILHIGPPPEQQNIAKSLIYVR